ncbi:MAG: 2-amino-4-hydroxy-6-hydroxymethyldihydropteridine diphosphokinase [Ginsengibacter sp.]
MNTLYLITGSNIGDRNKHLARAVDLIKKNIGIVSKNSSIYETEPWGNKSQSRFYNQILIVESKLSPENVMKAILGIEKEMGRIRTVKNAARIIDIDILFFNNEIINTPSVTVPHKEIQNRRFVLMPLNEIAPGLVHPGLGKTIRELLLTSKDKLDVKALSTF